MNLPIDSVMLVLLVTNLLLLGLSQLRSCVHAVAVPLRTRQGQTVAALNVVLAPGRLNDAALAGEILPRLREAAGEIRQLL